ncbi:MAG: flagellar assembly protein FliX [Alphaproteobacteria bacterium]|nr:MAG: flagellar assembly protein FliX [Alphaproteobacteria bacterium]
MRIEGPKRARPATPAPKTAAKGGGDGFASALAQSDGAVRARAPATATPLAAVDAIMRLQAVEDATQGRSRGLVAAGAMLDALEDIRRGLLAGAIPAAKLRALVDALDAQRPPSLDPRLGQLLDDIDLRARVELAKLGLRVAGN